MPASIESSALDGRSRVHGSGDGAICGGRRFLLLSAMRGHRSTLAEKRRRDFVTLQPPRDFRRHLRPHVVYLQFKRVSITYIAY